MMGLIRRLWRRLVATQRDYCVFTADPAQRIDGDTSSIQLFDQAHPPPDDMMRLYRSQFGARATWWMFRRLRADLAVYLALVESGTLKGMGWIQRWTRMRREFWWLAEDAVALGPYWTNPACRGQGVYGRLLARSLEECRRRDWNEVFIWADHQNAASVRGIEKAGFRTLGTHRVTVILNGLVRRHDVVREA